MGGSDGQSGDDPAATWSASPMQGEEMFGKPALTTARQADRFRTPAHCQAGRRRLLSVPMARRLPGSSP